MTSTTYPMREKKPQQMGNYLLDQITPKTLKAKMDENQHALSDMMLDDPSWEYFVWNGVMLTSPMLALRGAEEHGLYKNKPIPLANIVNSNNNQLIALGKKTITDNSVLSNLKKAAKYLNTAYNLVLRPDSLNMTVTLLNAADTDKEIEKWYKQMESRLDKIIKLANHAKNSDFKQLPSLPKAQQKFLKLNEAFDLETGNNNE
tara:strand:+ start:103 stop:711 length:609 start_codon:yes stop_codon:yes gene_type:complete